MQAERDSFSDCPSLSSPEKGRFFALSPTAMDGDAFVARFGGVFEHSPWIAAAVLAEGLNEQDGVIEHLHRRFAAVFLATDSRRQDEVICGHPELAAPAARADNLAADSRREQRRAGLDSLSPEEAERLAELNRAYRKKFGFPFILAVEGLRKEDVLTSAAARLRNSRAAERRRALEEICAIALLRMRRL